jgi:hypothetical protein
MTFLDLLGYAWFLLVMPIVALFFLGRPFWAMLTQRPSDMASIKARYEGVVSPVGPYSKVETIERIGTLVSRYRVARRYRVVLKRPDGREITKTVYVDVGLLGGNDVSEN